MKESPSRSVSHTGEKCRFKLGFKGHHINKYYSFPSICFTIVTMKTCVGWFGRKFLLCYFPLAATEEHEGGCIFLAGIMGSVMTSAFKGTRKHKRDWSGWSYSRLLRQRLAGQRSSSGLMTAALTCGDEQGGSLGNNTLVAFLHFVSEEHFALIGRGAPCLV